MARREARGEKKEAVIAPDGDGGKLPVFVPAWRAVVSGQRHIEPDLAEIDGHPDADRTPTVLVAA